MTKGKGSLIVLSLALVLAFGLFGCSGGSAGENSTGNPANENPTETVTPCSIVYADKQLVFEADEVAKDSYARLYVFENGQMSFRSNSTIKLGDLVEMSDEEIEAAYRSADEASRLEKHTYENTFWEFTKAPTVSTVELYTDDSGNVVEYEFAILSDYEVHQVSEGEAFAENLSTSKSFSIEFFDIVDPAPIFSGYFGGFNGNAWHEGSVYLLIKLDSADEVVFAWDELGTEGTVAK